MQNIVSEKEDFKEGIWWREAFQAPTNRTLIVSDYSSQEVCVMAYLSKDTKTIEAIKSGKDLHKIAAAALYQISTDEVTKLQRQNGKIFRFAAAYGAKEDKIAEQFGISKAEAKKLINNYFNEYPALLEFQQSTFLETLNRG